MSVVSYNSLLYRWVLVHFSSTVHSQQGRPSEGGGGGAAATGGRTGNRWSHHARLAPCTPRPAPAVPLRWAESIGFGFHLWWIVLVYSFTAKHHPVASRKRFVWNGLFACWSYLTSRYLTLNGHKTNLHWYLVFIPVWPLFYRLIWCYRNLRRVGGVGQWPVEPVRSQSNEWIKITPPVTCPSLRLVALP